MDNLLEAIPFILPLLMVGLLIYFLPKSAAMDRKLLAEKGPQLFPNDRVEVVEGGIKLFGVSLSSYLRVHRDNQYIEMFFYSGGKNSPPHSYFYIPIAVTHQLIIYRENIFTSISKSVGLTKEVTTNNPVVDKSFVIKASDGIDRPPLLMNGEFLQKLESLSKDKFLSEIRCNPPGDSLVNGTVKRPDHTVAQVWPGIIVTRTRGKRTLQYDIEAVREAADLAFFMGKQLA